MQRETIGEAIATIIFFGIPFLMVLQGIIGG